MTGRISRFFPMLVLAALVGCGTTKTVTVTEEQTVTVAAPTATTDNLPPIDLETPRPGDSVKSPLRATGTANTFEATFQYELLDAQGQVLSRHFEMATSGNGTRGTFDFSVPFQVERGQSATFVVYEISAANGKRIHEVRIPIQLEP